MGGRRTSGGAVVGSYLAVGVVVLSAWSALFDFWQVAGRWFGSGGEWTIAVHAVIDSRRAPGEQLNMQGVPNNAYYTVGDLPGGLEAMLAIGPLARSVCIVFAALTLIWWLDRIRSGRPFEARNSRRLVRLAILVVIGGVLAPIVEHYAGDEVIEYVRPAWEVEGVPNVPLIVGSVILASLLLVTADAFRRGRDLAADVEGLV